MPSDDQANARRPLHASRLEPLITIDRRMPGQLLVRLNRIDSGLWHEAQSYEWASGFVGSIILDLNGAPVITSVFAGWLVGLVRSASPNRVILRGCSDRVREILVLLRLDLLVGIESGTAPHA